MKTDREVIDFVGNELYGQEWLLIKEVLKNWALILFFFFFLFLLLEKRTRQRCQGSKYVGMIEHLFRLVRGFIFHKIH